MLIWDWNSADVAMWNLVVKNQAYRCSMDGHHQFQGETLPEGTEEYILDWIKARYKVVGEILIVNMDNMDIPRYNIIFNTCAGSKSLSFSPIVKRYLVEVDDKEKVFVLTPLPDQKPYGLLTWQKMVENSPSNMSPNMV